MKEVTKTCEICGRKVLAFDFMFIDNKVSGLCILKNNSGLDHIKIRRKQVYDAISQKKKQMFLDYFWSGKTVGESYKLAGLNQEEGFAVMDLNIENAPYLRREAKRTQTQELDGGKE